MGVYLGVGTIIDDYSAMQGPCDTGFHVPMKSEWDTIKSIGVSLGAWTSSGGNNMRIYLKLPFAGARYNTSPGSTFGQGTDGIYWFCSLSNNKLDRLYMNSSTISFNSNNYSCSGLCIRPIKDVPVAPDSNRTVLYQGTGTAGIYHNSTLGLISLSSDGTNWITIADKNLGATTVYNNGNTLSEANCGKYYQWGNNYGFPRTGNVTTSSTQVDAQNYGPGNYYSSSTYIVQTGEIRWDSSNNNDLRGGETGVQPKTVYPELKNAYIGEVYEYSYTFKGKTASEIGNEWDLLVGSIGVNSEGLSQECRIKKDISQIADAKRIIITSNNVCYNTSSATTIGIGTGTGWGNGGVYYNQTGSNFSGIQALIVYNGSEYKGSAVGYLSTGTYNPTVTIDLENKTIVGELSGYNNSTVSLTDAQVSAIKQYPYLFVYTSQNNAAISNVSITIEY